MTLKCYDPSILCCTGPDTTLKRQGWVVSSFVTVFLRGFGQGVVPIGLWARMGRGSVVRSLAMRRLYYLDSYGRVHRDRQAEKRTSSSSGVLAKVFLTILMLLAGIMVIASLIH